MADTVAKRPWREIAVFTVLGFVLILGRTLPLSHGFSAVPGPDLFLALALAWVVRAPESAPIMAVALLALVADFLLQRPPGLWAGLLVMGSETLRRRSDALRESGFLLEFVFFVLVTVAITVVYRLVLILFVVATPPPGLAALQLLFTLLAYPVIWATVRSVHQRRDRRSKDAYANEG